MNIADTHLHIWDLENGDYPWLKGNESILNRSFTVSEMDAERERAGVTAAILVQASGNAADTELMLKAAREYEWIKGVVGWLPLQQPGETQRLLEETYLPEPYFKGVRHQVHDEANNEWLVQPAVLESLNIVAENKLPYDMVGISTAHLQTALKLAELVPSLRIVLDHLNQPPVMQAANNDAWFHWMKEAAKHKNVYAKISGLGTARGHTGNWTAGDIKPVAAFVLDEFGSDRCFCGSDWPVCLLAGDYESTWMKYRTVLRELLTEAELENVLFNNAAGFYSF